MGLYRDAEICIEDLLQYLSPPEKNCSCHLSPPCSDCVDYAAERQSIKNAKETLKKLHAALMISPEG